MTILRDFIDAQRVHCDRLTSIILHHAAQPESVTVERGNTADLADAEDMRSLLMEQGQEPSAAGLAEFIRFARMGEDEKDEAKKETEAARERLIYITSGDPRAILAELVSTAGEALDDLHRNKDHRDAAVTEARQTLSAALGVSPNTSIDLMIDDVAETMSALRRALGCPDGASAGQILAEAALLRKEASTMAADRARIVRALDRAIDPEGNGPTGDTLDERVEEVVSVFHAQAAAIEGMHGVIRERDAQIAALTPGPWIRLGDTAPDSGETVLMWSGVQGKPVWMTRWNSESPPNRDFFWRRFPAGLLDVPAPAVAP